MVRIDHDRVKDRYVLLRHWVIGNVRFYDVRVYIVKADRCNNNDKGISQLIIM